MPVARWRLDDGLGDPAGLIAQDDYGIHQGTLEDYAAPTWILGKLEDALAFDGISNNVDCGSTELLDITGALTLMTWMNKTDGNLEIRGSDAVPLNDWHHVAAVFKPGDRMTLFVDGLVYHQVTDSIPVTTKIVAETPFTMGQIDTNGNGYAFYGLLDDVRMYRVAMSQREITGIVLNSLIGNE